MSSDLRNVADTGARGESVGYVVFDDLVTDLAVAGGVSFAAAENAIGSLISAGHREVLGDFEGSMSFDIEWSLMEDAIMNGYGPRSRGQITGLLPLQHDTRRKPMQDEFYEDDPDDWDEEKLKRFDQAVEDRKAARGKVRSRKAAIKSLLHQGATMKRTASMKVRRDK